MDLVLDASVMLRWYFVDEGAGSDELIRSLASRQVFVPSHWQAEVANGIIVGERRGRALLADIGRLRALVETFEPFVDREGADTALDRVLPLARAHRLTVYDAMYLELAGRRGLALATFDGPLGDAARSVGITVLH
jgi:predicted nucleic acid-binding protein